MTARNFEMNNNSLRIKMTEQYEQNGFLNSTVNIYRRDNGQLDTPELVNIYQQFEIRLRNDPHAKIIVRGLNANRWFTLKGLNTALNIQSFEDYYRGRVQFPSRFEKWRVIQLIIRSTAPN